MADSRMKEELLIGRSSRLTVRTSSFLLAGEGQMLM